MPCYSHDRLLKRGRRKKPQPGNGYLTYKHACKNIGIGSENRLVVSTLIAFFLNPCAVSQIPYRAAPRDTAPRFFLPPCLTHTSCGIFALSVSWKLESSRIKRRSRLWPIYAQACMFDPLSQTSRHPLYIPPRDFECVTVDSRRTETKTSNNSMFLLSTTSNIFSVLSWLFEQVLVSSSRFHIAAACCPRFFVLPCQGYFYMSLFVLFRLLSGVTSRRWQG